MYLYDVCHQLSFFLSNLSLIRFNCTWVQFDSCAEENENKTTKAFTKFVTFWENHTLSIEHRRENKLKCPSRNRVANFLTKSFEYIMIENDTRTRKKRTFDSSVSLFCVSIVSCLPICRHSVCIQLFENNSSHGKRPSKSKHTHWMLLFQFE